MVVKSRATKPSLAWHGERQVQIYVHRLTLTEMCLMIVFLTSQSTKIVKELRAKQQISAGPSDIEVMNDQCNRFLYAQVC